MSKNTIAIAVILLISLIASIHIYIQQVKDCKPNHVDDGWKVATPDELEINNEPLKRVDNFVKGTDATSLIIVKDGCILFEQYYRGQRPKNFTYGGSLANTMLSALTGIAISQNYIKSVDEKVADFYPEFSDLNFNPEIRNITIRHLLTMTSGFGQADDDFFHTMNWINSQIGNPLKSRPGSEFRYSNTATYLLSGIITRATGMSALDYAKENLLKPLKINDVIWYSGPEGYNTGGDFLYLKPADMAKFAYVYMNKGMWNTDQIIPEIWVEDTFRIQTKINDQEKKRFGSDGIKGFGYNFVISELKCGELAYFPEYEIGNQNICIVPAFNMVIVITTYPSLKDKFSYSSMKQILDDYIVPAIK